MKNPWKTALIRGLLGAPLGITISQVIALIISACKADGRFYAISPSLVAQFGSEFSAALVTTVLVCVLGFAFAAASVLFQLENWSILKQTGAHFLITAAVYMAVAYVLYWFERSLAGIASTLGVFLCVYLGIWLGQYLGNYFKIRAINKKLSER